MPPAPKSEEIVRKRRDRRAKMLLLLLVPALGIAVAIQAPRLLKHLNTAKEKTADVQGQVVQGYEELAPSTPATTGTGEVSPSDGAALVAIASGGFTDTDPLPEPGEDELIVFTRFSAQDPFVQLVKEGEGTGTTEATDSGTAGTPAPTSTGGATTAVSGGTGTTSGQTATQATISVNGSSVVVQVGETFPEQDPAFRLVAIEGNVAKIGLSSGAFANGVDTLDLEPGESVTLISQPDGARFTLKLIEIG
jgi:hypothetical protein